ncbi:MAG: HD family phosphohydrolase [Candidatus Methylacidiphilales bacterium]|nr:HDIG domain-containing protein [Candidatus Methylacidiphilales bacterium]
MIGFDWFQRQRLVSKGLACQKMRRNADEDSWRECFDANRTVKLAILSAYAFSLYALAYWGSLVLGTPYPSNESNLITFIIFLVSMMMLELEHGPVWTCNSKLALLLGAIVVNIFTVKGMCIMFKDTVPQTSDLYFLLPTALAPLCISLLLGTRPALYTVFVTSILLSHMMAKDFSLLVISLVAGFTAVYFTKNIRKRGDLVKSGVAIGIASLMTALAFGLILGHDTTTLGIAGLRGILMGMATALLVSAILPILESTFDIITDMSWIELADLNHPLLQRMTIEAPGTYHHSLVVANLVEAASKSLGLNPTQARVLALFHDIGKTIKPSYFTENIASGQKSPHDNISPTMSALIIIAHVKEGVDLALQYRLKPPIIDAIQQHHGDSLVYYFYRRAKQQEDDAREGGKIMNLRADDIPQVSQQQFRYPGPRPQTPMVGLLCMADAIEAASRSLDKPTPQKIESLVEEIIQRKISEGQLDECHLTLNQIRTASESFVFTVKSVLHQRISYPPKETKSDDKSDTRDGRPGTGHGHGHGPSGTALNIQSPKKAPAPTSSQTSAAA